MKPPPFRLPPGVAVLAILLASTVLLLAGCTRKPPTLTERQQQWVLYAGSPTPGAPLEIHEYGHRLLGAYETPPDTSKGKRWVPARQIAEWGWKAVVENAAAEPRCTRFTYTLRDRKGRTLTSDTAAWWVKPGPSLTLFHAGEIPYRDADRVKSGLLTWSSADPGSCGPLEKDAAAPE